MTPIIYGEVLFDEFPDGARILGGAPFNVAWHLRAFGLDPLLVSRIGHDELGNTIEETMKSWQMKTIGLQHDAQHATGRVIINQSETSHSFEIPSDQAFDYINQDEIPEPVFSGELLYYGSLCLRNTVSQNTLKNLLKLKLKHFVDINLRSPWWNDNVLNLVLNHAHWLKINDEELEILNGAYPSIEESIKTFYQRHTIHTLVVTCGENGAYIYDGNHLIHNNKPALKPIKDTVGAGDAFSSVLILGLHYDWPIHISLSRALAFAADICCIQGATNKDKSFYQRHIDNWMK